MDWTHGIKYLFFINFNFNFRILYSSSFSLQSSEEDIPLFSEGTLEN